MAFTWFRFYNGAVNDPKVQRLTPILFRFWVNSLCLASANDGWLPSEADMAFSLRLSPVQLSDYIGKLISLRLFDKTEQGIRPHNWENRQYKSDGSTERVKRFRERSRSAPETANETGPDSDTDQTQNIPSLRSGKPAKRKRSLPLGFPEQSDLDWSIDYWLKKGRTDLCNLREEEASKFRDHHTAKGTTSADWPASWRTWTQNTLKFSNGAHNGRRPNTPQDFAFAAFEV